MQALPKEQRKYDRELPVDSFQAVRAVEFNKDDHRPRFSTESVTDDVVEKFIAELVAAPNKDIFLENNIGALPRSASNEYPLQIAVAQQWVKDVSAVGEIIGSAFWQWAKGSTFIAVRMGWSPAPVAA